MRRERRRRILPIPTAVAKYPRVIFETCSTTARSPTRNAAACSVVELDVLTGEVKILSSDIVYDIGWSLNPALDIGQVDALYFPTRGGHRVSETGPVRVLQIRATADVELAHLRPGDGAQ